jgi:hypothetical protein
MPRSKSLAKRWGAGFVGAVRLPERMISSGGVPDASEAGDGTGEAQNRLPAL